MLDTDRAEPNEDNVAAWERIRELVESGQLETEPRLLTDDEQALADAEKAQRPSRAKIGARGEAVVKSLLESRLHATLRKVAVQPTEITDKRTQSTRTIYIGKDVDYEGDVSLRLNGSISRWPTRIEVKTITSERFALKSLTAAQQRHLEKARREGKVAWIALVWYARHYTCQDCGHVFSNTKARKCPECYSQNLMRQDEADRIHLIPWREWTQVKLAIAQRAREDRRFRGKSLRRKIDWDLLHRYEIVKTLRRWKFVEDHWLLPYLPTPDDSQLELPF